MSMNIKEFMDKDVYAEDMKIGKIKEMGIDPEDWKVTHLEVELTKDVAESVLGAKKGGVRNKLDVTALERARWTDRGLNLKVPTADLHTYLKPVAEI
jgi:sporulation protein YlmC with PRC-barrel domain